MIRIFIFYIILLSILSGCTISGSILSEFSLSPRTMVELIPGSTAPSVNGGNQNGVPISGYCPDGAKEVQIGVPLNQTIQCQNGQFVGTIDLSGLPDGSYQIIITPDKGESFTWSFVKDTVLPTVTSITIPAIANSGNLSSLPVSGSCSESNQDVTIQYGSITTKVPCTSGTFSANLDLSGLNDGTHTVSITIKDGVGNLSSTYTGALTKDTLGPAAPVLANYPTGSSPIINLNIPISGTDISHYRYVIGPAGSIDCSNPGLYSSEIPVSTNITDDISGLADGTIKLCVWPRDSAGNYLPIASVTPVTWVKDSTIALAILSAYLPSGSPSNSTVNRTMSVSGVSIISYKYVSVKDAFCSTADFSSAVETAVAVPITLSIGGGDGTYRACVIGKNSLGNWQPTASSTSSADLVIDTTLPTLTIASVNTDPTNSNISVTVTFSEAVTGFASSDVNLTNASLSGWSGGPTIYHFTLTPLGQGAVTATIGAGDVFDLAGNANIVTGNLSRVFDSIQPSVNISSSAGSQTNISPVPFTITFSESVADFISSDVTITNGIITGFSGGPTVYNLQVTPIAEGVITMDVGSGVAHDSAGNANLIATSSVSRTYDITSPTVTLSTVATNPTSNAFVVTATFSESVIGLSSTDFGLTNATISGFSGGPSVYTFTVTPIGQGLVQVDLLANECQDGAGNQNVVATPLSRTYDSLPPTLTLTTSATNPTNAAFTVTATFSESVSGFTNGDVSIVNGTMSNFSGGPSVYSFDVTPTTDGLVTVSVGAGVAQDGVSLPNLAATDLNRNYDSTMPSVALSSAALNPTNGPFSITATFSEPVTGFTATDIVSPKASIANFSGGPTVFTFDVTPLEDGLIVVDIPTSSCTDLGGSPNIAGTLNRTVDTGNPSVTIATPTLDITDVSPIPFAILFSEDITGFISSDVNITNGTLSNFVSDGNVFRFDVTPSSAGAVTVSVNAGAAQDLLGNLSPSASLTITYDPVPLTATISSTTPSIFNSGNMSVTVNFNKNTTLVAADIMLTNSTLANISGAGSSYTVEITPVGQGRVGLDLAKVTDRPSISRIYDSLPPTAPSGLSIDDTNMTFFHTPKIVWSTDASDGPTGSGITEYQVQVYDQWGAEHGTGMTIVSGERKDLIMKRWEKYYAKVRAKDGAGNWSPYSAATPLWMINRKVIANENSDTMCMIQMNGQAKCWGRNQHAQVGTGVIGEIGDNVGEISGLPDINVGTGRSVKSIYPGFLHTCAILDNDKVKCWGYNNNGQLGQGPAVNAIIGDSLTEMGDNLPYVDFGVGRTVKMMTAGFYHNCAVLDDDSFKCWGDNTYGQLGNGSTSSFVNTPVAHLGLGTGLTVKKMASGFGSVCILFTNNKIKCWGNGAFGLGYENTTNIYTAGQLGDNLPFVNFGTGRTAVDITFRSGNFCALLDNSTVKCWARNSDGVGGNGTNTYIGTSANTMGDNLNAIPLGTGLTPVQVAVGVHSNIIRFSDGTIKSFGLGGYLGLGDTVTRYLLTALGDNLPFLNFGGGRKVVDVVNITAGGCATLEDKSIICWGLNNLGQVAQENTNTIGDNEAITSFIAPAWFSNLQIILNASAEQVAINSNITLQGSGGFSPYTYSITSGGGTINSSSGVYTAPGIAGSVTIQVQDAQGNTATKTITITNCLPGSMAFSYTGTSQTFTMPAGCTKATVKAWGGGGAGGSQWGSYGNYGGGGGYATGILNLTPGENLTVNVGGGGIFAGGGGWNGGASAGPPASDPFGGTTPRAGGGGGATDIRRIGTALSDRVLVAGGGGGGGSCYKMFNNACVGGAGGGSSGVNGTMYNGTVTIKIGFGSATATVSGYGGIGGTVSAGGGGGVCTSCSGSQGGAGSLGIGGIPTTTSTIVPGGGGGGGYYGGGGGASWSGGGGGSSYFGGMSSGSAESGSSNFPGNSSDIDRSGAGLGGGIAGSGGSGRVVIYYE